MKKIFASLVICLALVFSFSFAADGIVKDNTSSVEIVQAEQTKTSLQENYSETILYRLNVADRIESEGEVIVIYEIVCVAREDEYEIQNTFYKDKNETTEVIIKNCLQEKYKQRTLYPRKV